MNCFSFFHLHLCVLFAVQTLLEYTALDYVFTLSLREITSELIVLLFGYYQECDHNTVPQQRKYVRVSYFRSGWRIKKGKCLLFFLPYLD